MLTTKQLLYALTLLLCCASLATAQTAADSGQLPSSPRERDSSPLGSPEDELRERAAIRHAESTYQESLDGAKESAQLGADLQRAFASNKALSREDLKKLERMEKLARKIRGRAGGSDDDEQLKDPPQSLDAALHRLAELSELLRKNVEKTSRLVVSASVIERSNELIELIRLIRTLAP